MAVLERQSQGARDLWVQTIRDSAEDLSPRARLAAFVMASYADADGRRCFPSAETIADGMGQSADTAWRAIRDLEVGGWLIRRVQHGRTTFVLLIPDEVVTKFADDVVASTVVHEPVDGGCTGAIGTCRCSERVAVVQQRVAHVQPVVAHVQPYQISTRPTPDQTRPRAVRHTSTRPRQPEQFPPTTAVLDGW